MDVGKIEQALGEIKLSQPKRSITQLNLVRDIKISRGKVNVKLALNVLPPQDSESVQAAVRTAVTALDDIKEISTELVDARPVELNRFGHVIAIMSGKGGVGKSLVTGLIALALKREGYDTGILDADITGPSIPKMFGIKTHPNGTEGSILTVESSFGIQVMSLNLLLPNEDDAVIWRGPILAKVITQFWRDVLWGQLDYLLVDLPPGTADIPLTVLQSLPLSG